MTEEVEEGEKSEEVLPDDWDCGTLVYAELIRHLEEDMRQGWKMRANQMRRY